LDFSFERGSADSERDPRGFAVKFYTGEGIYDFVGNNTPVFFIRDAMKFPDFIHTQKRNPGTNLKNPDMFWDFLSLTPESIHQITVLFSDRGTPFSYRHINGYSGHTFMWYNANGDYSWIKIHFKTDQKVKSLTREEAQKLAGTDPDHATRDLHHSIKGGEYPSWTVYVQIMPPEDSKRYRFDPFDITKVWPHADYPLQRFGKMVLNRNPENYFAETEQAAFSPGNFVPGIGPSPDKMLQGRLFSYHDTHLHRLGANYHLLPINASKSAVHSNERDGAMRSDVNGSGSYHYWPNSFGGASPDTDLALPPVDVAGMATHHEYRLGDVDFVQPGELYRQVMTETEREHLVSNIVTHLGGAQKRIQLRQTSLFYKVDAGYGERVANGLGLNLEEVKRLSRMSQEDRVKATAG
ncbi:MAG: catalase, partial [Candidatus Electryoneaceae bacterium]|nr:catalase [Candidatus Electryoneaceae bacterium]